jgi:hypothetical protein
MFSGPFERRFAALLNQNDFRPFPTPSSKCTTVVVADPSLRLQAAGERELPNHREAECESY